MIYSALILRKLKCIAADQMTTAKQNESKITDIFFVFKTGSLTIFINLASLKFKLTCFARVYKFRVMKHIKLIQDPVPKINFSSYSKVQVY